MVTLSKKVDYALTSLAHLVENQGQTVSARQIADMHGLPLPLLMKILKMLHQHGILVSTRGVKGGYQLAINLDELSLGRLIAVVDGNGSTSAAPPRVESPRLSLQPPVQALQYKLVRVLHDVKVTDLVKPGRRIDVPWERVARQDNHKQPMPLATPA